jgi:Zn-dependent alcohol dehydrogenase
MCGCRSPTRSPSRSPDGLDDTTALFASDSAPTGWMSAEQAKQLLRLETDRPHALRQAILACRKGGTVFVLGVFAGMVDKFPMGALMNKGLTLRSAQQHGERYIPMLLERMASGELRTAHLATHPMPLDEGPRGYELFKHKQDGCVRSVFQP